MICANCGKGYSHHAFSTFQKGLASKCKACRIAQEKNEVRMQQKRRRARQKEGASNGL